MKNLKILRLERGLTMEKLGEELSFTKSTINRWENGSREADYNTLEKLANFFGVSIDFLLGRTNERSPGIIENKHNVLDDYSKEDLDFTFALHGEVKDLTDEQKKLIIELARSMNKGK